MTFHIPHGPSGSAEQLTDLGINIVKWESVLKCCARIQRKHFPRDLRATTTAKRQQQDHFDQMSDSRARRAAKPASKAKSSLAQLAELRRTGAKRVHDFELTEEDAVYDEVQEQDYAKLVQDRREEAGPGPGY